MAKTIAVIAGAGGSVAAWIKYRTARLGRINRIEARMDGLTDRIDARDQEIAMLRIKIGELQKQNTDQQAQINQLKVDLKTKEDEVDRLRHQRDTWEQAATFMREELKRHGHDVGEDKQA